MPDFADTRAPGRAGGVEGLKVHLNGVIIAVIVVGVRGICVAKCRNVDGTRAPEREGCLAYGNVTIDSNVRP